MFESEFKKDDGLKDIFRHRKLRIGRMLSWSKGDYLRSNPENLVAFNANIITEEDGKIWYGDLDVSRDFDALKSIADEIGKDLYVLREHDGRFDNENKDFKFYKDKSIATIKCN